jgi:DNA segregation ATPase FtsK/SpoIIIE, S-DNA-T family
MAIEQSEVLEGQVIPKPSIHQLTRVYKAAQTVATHKHTRRTALHLGYVPVGVYAVAKAAWESRSTGRYERRINLALATGQPKEAKEWEAAKLAWVQARHQRRMQRREMTLKTIQATPYIAAGSVGVLGIVGALLAISDKNIAEFAVPFVTVAHIIAWVAFVVSVTWGPFILALPWLTVAALWYVGRRFAQGTDAPTWMRTSGDGGDFTIDESAVAQALKALGIKQIGDALKLGPLPFITPCRVDGRGTHFQVRLPAGVPAEKIARRRADMAAGLHRQTKEVWLSTGEDAAILNGWIADKGALAEGAGPYPLVDDGFTNVFKGLPFGKNLRGEPVRIPVIGRNSITGGMPEQGKSSGARIVAAGYALDISTEMRIYVPDLNFDFQAFEPRCSRFVVGAEDEYIRQIRDDLAELEEEIQRHGQLLIDCGQPEVTAEVAARVPGLHPMFVLLEEAHVAIQHPEYGKAISQSLINIVKLDRKRGIHLMVSTQAPTKDSMPRDVTRNCSNGIAFAVGDHVANDALLGQGAYSGGHRATDLIPGADRGTALCKGFSGQRSELVQVHFLSVKRDNDQVAPIVKRALDQMKAEGRAVPGTDRARVIEQRDLLADLDAVLSRDKTRLADIPALLKRLAPAWPAYKGLNGVGLAQLLDELGVRHTNPGNVPTLDPADARKVLQSGE